MCVCVCVERVRVTEEARLNGTERELLCKLQFSDHNQFLHNCMTCIAKCKVIDFSWLHFTFFFSVLLPLPGVTSQPDSFFPVQIP